MAKLITYFDDASSLIDMAVALMSGQLETNMFAPVTASAVDGENKLSINQLLDTDIIPTNGNVNGRLLISRDDDDVDMFVPINGKAVEGNLFVAYRAASDEHLGTASSSDLSSYLDDIRQICDDAEALFTQGLQITGGKLESAGSMFVFAYGILKETQTDNYNPLSVINVGWTYKMFDRETVLSLLSENRLEA